MVKCKSALRNEGLNIVSPMYSRRLSRNFNNMRAKFCMSVLNALRFFFNTMFSVLSV